MSLTPIPYADSADTYDCPADGVDHEPDPETVEMAPGYNVKAEKGIVVRMFCRKCHNVGNYRIPLYEILW